MTASHRCFRSRLGGVKIFIWECIFRQNDMTSWRIDCDKGGLSARSRFAH